MCITRALTAFGVVGIASIATAQSPTMPARQLAFGTAKELARGAELNILGEAVAGPGGSAYILDVTNYQVLAVDSLGATVWRAGRQGSGPGEFRLPYRLAARPRGGVAVLDWGSGRVTLLSANGKLDGSLQLPFPLTQIDGMLILPDGRFLLAAVTNWGSTGASDRSIHVLSDSLMYQRSFAPLAAALDTSAVRYVGSGGFALDRNGQILFTPKRPFEIQRYTADGRLVEKIPVGATLQYDLGDFIAIQQSNGQTFKSTTAKTKFVEVPLPVRELPGGGFIGGRGTFEKTTVDLISGTGALEFSAENPAGCVQILGFDVERGQMYCRALRNDVPALLRVPFTIIPRGGKP